MTAETAPGLPAELEAAIDAFAFLSDLEPGWDSYGASRIDPECITKARDVYSWLPHEHHWSIVPCSDGGVQLEQHAGGFDIEITIANANRARPHDKDCRCNLCVHAHKLR